MNGLLLATLLALGGAYLDTGTGGQEMASPQAACGRRAGTGSAKSPDTIRDTVDALGLKEGSQVADVGSGDGDYVEELSKRVAAAGRVHAVDIDEKRAIPKLRALVANKKLENVTVRVGEPANPKLPEDASVDAVLIVNAYHEMTEYKEMLKHIRTALKPGGRLVVVDSIPLPGLESSGRAEQSRRHQLAADFAEPDLREAGFEVVERRDRFVTNTSGPRGSRWMIVVRKPM